MFSSRFPGFESPHSAPPSHLSQPNIKRSPNSRSSAFPSPSSPSYPTMSSAFPDDRDGVPRYPVSPVLSKTERLMKFGLLCFNLVVLIFSCILIAVGSYALNDTGVGHIAGDTLPYGIIVLGVFFLVLSLLGLCATYFESNVGLAIYFIVMFIMCILLISVGIAVYVRKNDAPELISQGWNSAAPDVRYELELEFKCCGLGSSSSPPPSNSSELMCPSQLPDLTPYTDACLPKMVALFESKFQVAGACGIVFSIIIFACLAIIIRLMQGIKTKGYRMQMEEAKRNGEGETQSPGF